ncbi:hypothetical protein SAMN05444372_102324 [Flavobacterium micromati]|uniref:Uncharacterized protein n=1 Tax=Flavobacterium micromati TaxID=229205 RepID=A0A1M5H7H5_9FLAO|nr:hypothetical protein [Flavobacterium micromati]SHG11959.1 hypothetical protein SAMN05444372_102324 [Flavobacterium micromati]
MKTKKSDLEIDRIGGIGSLTIEEEKALSDFFKKKKTTKKTLKKKEINT